MTEPDPNQPPTPDGAQPTPGPDQPPAPTGQPPVAPGPAPSGQPPVTPEPAPGIGYPQGDSGPAGPYGAPAPAPTDPYGGSAPGPVYPTAASAPGPAPAYPTAASAPGPGPAPVYPTGGEYPPAAPSYVPPAPQGRGPSRGLSITGLVLGVIPCTALIGVVLSIVALVKGRGSADSSSRVMAIIGLVIGALWTVVAIWSGVLFLDIYRTCDELGNGVHYVDGVRYDCSF